MIIVELIYNLSLLVALSVLSGFVDQRWRRDTRNGLIIQGGVFGVVAILGMMNPFVLGPGLIFDGRSVVISLCALFFGPLPVTIAAGISILYRLLEGGVGAVMGVSVIVASALIGLLFHFDRRNNRRNITALYLLLLGLAVHSMMFLLAFTLPIQDALMVLRNVGVAVALTYPPATILIGKILSDQEVNARSVNALKESESLFRSIAQTSPIGICKTDPSGILSFVNDRWCEITGLRPSEVLFRSFAHFILKDDRENVKREWDASLKEQRLFEFEYRMEREDGAQIWINSRFAPEIDSNGIITGYIGTMSDISRRKNAEDAMRTSEERYRSISELISDYAYAFRVETDNTLVRDWVTQAFYRITGYTEEEIEAKGGYGALIHPDDLLITSERHDRLLRGKSDVTEFRIICKDGGVKWLRDHGYPVMGKEQGRVVYIYGAAQDITKKKEIESALRESETRYKRLFEDNISAMFVSTVGGTVIDCNPAFIRLFGIDSRDEALKRNISDFFRIRSIVMKSSSSSEKKGKSNPTQWSSGVSTVPRSSLSQTSSGCAMNRGL